MLQDTMEADGAERAVHGLDVISYQSKIVELEREVVQLREAVERRQQYGIVTGVLAARYQISPDRAWKLLVRLSQHSNLKVSIVARVLYNHFFGQTAPEDEAFAALLSAQMHGRLESMKPVVANGNEA